MPILCNYYLTYRCNAYCSFCHFGDHESFRTTPYAALDDVLRNLPALRKLGVRFIDFTGGEPLLYPHIAEVVAEAKRFGMRTSITTNGLLYAKHAHALKGKVDLLHFSLDSADPAEHDGLRGVACFDAVINGIDLAKSLGERPDLIFTVTESNYRQLPAVYEIAAQHGLILLINPVFQYFKDEKLPVEILDFTEQAARRPLAYLNPSFISLRRRGGNDPQHPLCKAVSRVIVISPYNEILLPCFHFHYEKIPIGEDLLAAYRSPRIGWHRRHEGRHAFCKGCTINCYFEPSFAFPTNMLSIASIPSKFKYGWNKYLRNWGS
jgi:MoaA/NifB/PqqE/SkfB family radical SAM enzyme